MKEENLQLEKINTETLTERPLQKTHLKLFLNKKEIKLVPESIIAKIIGNTQPKNIDKKVDSMNLINTSNLFSSQQNLIGKPK